MSTVMSAPPEAPFRVADRPVTVAGRALGDRTGPVLVALDDDGNPGALLRHGWSIAVALGVPLRATYVWSDCRPPDCDHHRCCHRDLDGASRLLTTLIDGNLSVEAALRVERDVLHDADPAEALIALSQGASMLLVGASSHRPTAVALLGETTRMLLGRTWCPLIVVPHRRLSATCLSW
ncbi:universal stress protein [Actinoplanes sp. NPDC048967]|uniref:universal stress protein n=1 Tax=Actinoplanes sp. NPDC048967 TaxID=3155269 RepID=UPI0033D6C5D0